MLIVVERVLEALLFVVAAQAGRRLFGPADEPVPALVRRLIRRRLPVTAIVTTALLAAGGLLQVAWPGALDALQRQPHGAWWRTFTAPFVQTGGGLAGALFNIASAAIILALAEWQWGRLAAAAIWLTGAWAPVGDVARLAGYHVAAANTAAYSAGSSGATYFTAATLSAALLCTGALQYSALKHGALRYGALPGRGAQLSDGAPLPDAGRALLLAVAGPAIALVMWIMTDDGHGVLFIEGFVLGLLLRAALRALRIPAPPTAAAPRESAAGAAVSSRPAVSSCPAAPSRPAVSSRPAAPSRTAAPRVRGAGGDILTRF